MNVYVAGASQEISLVERYVRRVRELSITVTHDWCAVMRAEPRRDVAIPRVEMREYALEDLRGVAKADIFWLLAPEAQSTGCWTELGYALALSVPILVSGVARRRNVFTHLSTHEFESHDLAIDFLRGAT